jgi:hypothetical protein
MTAWINNAQAIELMKMRESIKDVFGEPYVMTVSLSDLKTEDDFFMVNKQLSHTFQIGNVIFKYKYSPILQEKFGNTPAMIIFPSDQVAMVQRPTS